MAPVKTPLAAEEVGKPMMPSLLASAGEESAASSKKPRRHHSHSHQKRRASTGGHRDAGERRSLLDCGDSRAATPQHGELHLEALTTGAREQEPDDVDVDPGAGLQPDPDAYPHRRSTAEPRLCRAQTSTAALAEGEPLSEEERRQARESSMEHAAPAEKQSPARPDSLHGDLSTIQAQTSTQGEAATGSRRSSTIPLFEVTEFNRCGDEFPCKWEVDCSHAIKVNVKVNVLEVTGVDVLQECFSVVVSLFFFYIDPNLRNFTTTVWYYNDDGTVTKEDECKLLSCDLTGSLVRVQRADRSEFNLRPTQVFDVKQPEWKDSGSFKLDWCFANVEEEPRVLRKSRRLEYCSDLGGHVREMVKYKVKFSERMELTRFPFDKQLLRLRVCGELPVWRMQFAPMSIKAGSVSAVSSAFLQKVRDQIEIDAVPTEWKLVRDVKLGREEVPVPCAVLVVKPPAKNDYRSTFQVMIHLQRIPQFYLYNAFLVNFALTLATITTFALGEDDFVGRASILFSLLLTTIGYKLVAATWLPVKSYLTFLDRYVLANLLIQGVVSFESFFVFLFLCNEVDDSPSRECGPSTREVEWWWARIFYGLWIVVHAVVLPFRCIRERLLYPAWDEVYKANGLDPSEWSKAKEDEENAENEFWD